MKNREFYANEIINMAIHGTAMGIDEDTLAPCSCTSLGCTTCLARNEDCCDNGKLVEWANAEHEDKYEHDEVVLWRDDMFDEWKPAHYAYYKDGRHYVYSDGRSSLTACKGATTSVNYIRKYDEELAYFGYEYEGE